MRAASVVFALCLVCTPAVAWAWSGGGGSDMGTGEIPCEHEADAVGRQIDSQAGRLSPAQLHQMREQLEVARSQCRESLNNAEPTLSMLRQQLAAPPGTAQ